jgi:murein L,D-transpeptidase YcbB/YkuD
MPLLSERSSATDRDAEPVSPQGLRADAGAPSCVALNRRLLLGVAAGAAGQMLMSGGRAVAQGVRGAPQSSSQMAASSLSPSQIELLATTLADAASHGFGAEDFGQSVVANALAARDPTAPDQLRAAILAYARAQRGQRLPSADFPEEWAVRPAPFAPQPSFEAAVASDSLASWLADLPPPYEGYEALRTALARYRDMASRHGWKPIADGPPLSLGASSSRVAALRLRLAAEDPSAPTGGDDPETFDQPLVAAVIKFQKRYGQVADGVVGPPTLQALNEPVGQRILQIEANMERWRWMPRTLPPSRIQVNTAAAVMAVYEDNRPVLAMKAVSGRPHDATPMLHSIVESIVLNPAWHVPAGIAQKELFPKERNNPGYFARNDFVVIQDENGGERLVQKAGPKSALGHFKFDFSNPFGVYLHDTPAHSGFARTSRLASHGCVRLEQPEALADLLLQGMEDWPPDRIHEIVQGDETVRVRLPRPIPVFILYWTAFGDGSGSVQFRNDAYDWDRKLLNLISAESASA